MSRRPNPWIAIPSLIAGAVAGIVGWIVTDVSCRTTTASGAVESCPGWAAGISIGSFLVVTIGMAVVLVLVYRSIAEHRDAAARGQEPPGPGCEV